MKKIERLLKTMVLRTLPGTTIMSCNFEGRVCDMVVDAPWEKQPKKMSFLLSERSEAEWKNNSWLGFTHEEVLSAQAIQQGLSDEKYEADEVYYVMCDPYASKGIFVRVLPEMDYTFLFSHDYPTISVALSHEIADIITEDGERTYGVAHKICKTHAHRI